MDKTASLPQVEGAALQNKAYTEAACAAVAQAVAEEMNQLFTSVSDGKSLIASAITDKGVATAADASFQTMSENIQAIQTGPSTGEPLDPMEVYNSTRPTDWLQMPEPQDNEMYLLFHIPNGVSSLLAFTVTCTGSYTVALGTVTGGQFTQQSSTTVASGGKYEAELFADSYGNLTSSGMKQVMVKVSGADILRWVPSAHSKKASSADFYNWNIVEIVCRLPQGEKVACGSTNNNSSLKAIRFFAWYGTNSVTSMSSMFSNCYSLTAIPQLDTSSVTNMSGMFSNCSSLTAIPQLDTSSVTNMNSMFNCCYSLTAIPQLDTSSVTNMSGMFYCCYSLTAIPQLNTSSVKSMLNMFGSCYSLTAIPQLDTSSVVNMLGMFRGCFSLTAIPQLDTSSVTNMNSMFSNCFSLTAIPQLDTSSVTDMFGMFDRSLAAITLDSGVTGWAGYDISLSNCSLGHKALVDLFNSLPTITSGKTLTLTGNPGVAELTDAEKAIATGKNWTLTL